MTYRNFEDMDMNDLGRLVGFGFHFSINPDGTMEIDDLSIAVKVLDHEPAPTMESNHELRDKLVEWLDGQMLTMAENFVAEFGPEERVEHCLPDIEHEELEPNVEIVVEKGEPA